MFAVCPSCRRFLGRRTPLEQTELVDEVCPACAARAETAGPAVVVVSRLREDTLAILRALLEAAPEFQVVLERRATERAPTRATPPQWRGRGAQGGAPQRSATRQALWTGVAAVRDA
jgi:hypothetical protein